MMRRFRRILIVAALLPLILLSSCIRLPGSGVSKPSPDISAEQISPSPSPAPTEWNSGVKTDYSYLTPYEPPTEKYTRLKDGPIPDLLPSGRYGSLLPYVGETMYSDDGYNTIRKYGLITADGMIVTDPVYTTVYQGSYYSNSTNAGDKMPVYVLVKLKDNINEESPWGNEINAVCALDGSWATALDYESVFCTDKVIVLVRDSAANDVDIIDYSGKLLYNTKTLSCYSSIPEASAYSFMSGYGEGFFAVPLSGGRSVIIDALTGSETYIDYEQCSAFSEGFAAVMKGGLYGYIDRHFNMVIPPKSLWYDYFHNGKSIVQYEDQSYAIIDAGGNILLENPYYITRWDNNIYGVYNSDNSITYLDSDLNEIQAPGGQQITPLYEGWFYFNSGRSVTIFKGNESHTFKGIEGIYGIRGDLAVVYSSGNDTYREGVMTLDGKTVVPMEDAQSVVLIPDEKTGETYILASMYFENQSYKVYDSAGSLLFSGKGYAIYNDTFSLFEVNDEFSYAYVDAGGNDIFRISLLQYVPD
jgi:hypothetical protein